MHLHTASPHFRFSHYPPHLSLEPLNNHRERNIPEIEIMYEQSFPRLSDRYFKQAPWPVVEAVSDLVDQDHVFCLLYKVGLYHTFQMVAVAIQQRQC